MPVSWLINGVMHDLAAQGWIMGVLNVTPDSFSDGGNFFDAGMAVEHGLKMVAEGASIIDIGGESTRPGATPVEPDEELRRVIPVIRSLRRQTQALISVDTMKPDVARVALDAGADVLNDVTGLRDPEMVKVAANSGAGVIAMHMQGVPATMQTRPSYRDVTSEVGDFFLQCLKTLEEAGIPRERVAFDPGIGFGKTLEHNLDLMRNLAGLRVEDRPLLLGISRKSFISRLTGDDSLASRCWPTVALTAWLRESGADILRVHNVKENMQALRMIEAVMKQNLR